MESLYNQISPYLTSVPAEDQTFRQYVDELLKSSSGFTGTFVNNSASKKDETPTTTITDGLFKKFLPESSYSDWSNHSQGTPVSEQIGVGNMTDAINQQGLKAFAQVALGGMLGGMPGMVENFGDLIDAGRAPQEYMDAINKAYDPLGAWAGSQGHYNTADYDPWSGNIASTYGTTPGSEQSLMLAEQEAGMFDSGSSYGGGDYGASDNSNRSDPSSYGSMADTAND